MHKNSEKCHKSIIYIYFYISTKAYAIQNLFIVFSTKSELFKYIYLRSDTVWMLTSWIPKDSLWMGLQCLTWIHLNLCSYRTSWWHHFIMFLMPAFIFTLYHHSLTRSVILLMSIWLLCSFSCIYLLYCYSFTFHGIDINYCRLMPNWPIMPYVLLHFIVFVCLALYYVCF